MTVWVDSPAFYFCVSSVKHRSAKIVLKCYLLLLVFFFKHFVLEMRTRLISYFFLIGNTLECLVFFLRMTLLFLFFTFHCNFVEFLNPLIHENY